MRYFYFKMQQLLQMCRFYYKMWKLLQNATSNTVGQNSSINQRVEIANETCRSFRKGLEVKGVHPNKSKAFDKI